MNEAALANQTCAVSCCMKVLGGGRPPVIFMAWHGFVPGVLNASPILSPIDCWPWMSLIWLQSSGQGNTFLCAESQRPLWIAAIWVLRLALCVCLRHGLTVFPVPSNWSTPGNHISFLVIFTWRQAGLHHQFGQWAGLGLIQVFGHWLVNFKVKARAAMKQRKRLVRWAMVAPQCIGDLM